MTSKVIGFIGLGLIGGSLAKRLKQVRPDLKIMAYMRTRQKKNLRSSCGPIARETPFSVLSRRWTADRSSGWRKASSLKNNFYSDVQNHPPRAL